MSGRRARKERQRLRSRPEQIQNAERIILVSQRMLALDLTHLPLTRTTQFIIGWMRASFGQALALATLTTSGCSEMAGPNRRSFAEIVARLLWLEKVPSEERAGTLDTIIEDEKRLTRKAFDDLEVLGYKSDADLSVMDEVLTQVTEHGYLKDQALKFLPAMKATDGQAAGLYHMWREETQYTHATGALAASYAPEIDMRLGHGRPVVVNEDLFGIYLCMVLAVTLSYRLLLDAGVHEDAASSIVEEFFG